MTDHRFGKSYGTEEKAEYAQWLHQELGIVCNARLHDWRLADGDSNIFSRTPQQTRDVFLNNPDAMLAVRTGPENGVTAFVVHTNGPGTGLNALIENGFFCPGCDVVTEYVLISANEVVGCQILLFRTGAHVFHDLHFSDLPGVVIQKSGTLATIAPGFSAGCAPSCPDTDLAYAYGRSYAEFGIPEMPEGLLDLYRLERSRVKQQERKQYVSKGVGAKLFDPISEGSRNSELARRAGYLIGRERMSEEAARDVLLHINDECCQPPLGAKEVADIARSISRRHARHG